MSRDDRQQAIDAARAAIDRIRHDQAIDTKTLATLARAIGEDTEFLDRYDESGFRAAIPSKKQRACAVSFLEDLIDDLEIERQSTA